MGYWRRGCAGRVAATLLAVALGVAQRASAQPAMGPPAVGVVQARRTPIIETNEFIGRISAVSRVALVARVTAFLDQRLFTEGTEVKAGDLLYRLEQAPFEADVMAKQAALGQVNALLENATQTLNRQDRPAEHAGRAALKLRQGGGPAAQPGGPGAGGAGQSADVADQPGLHAKSMPRSTAASAARNVTEGNVVGPSTGTLATIVSQDPMYVVLSRSPRARAGFAQSAMRTAGGFQSAVRVKIRLPTGEIYGQDGKLDYIDPTVSSTTDTLTARAVMPNPLPVTPGVGPDTWQPPADRW